MLESMEALQTQLELKKKKILISRISEEGFTIRQEICLIVGSGIYIVIVSSIKKKKKNHQRTIILHVFPATTTGDSGR